MGKKVQPKRRKHKQKERALYKPIAAYLRSGFRFFGHCKIFVTSPTIPRKVQKRLDNDALFYVRNELKPDLMGLFEPTQKSIQLMFIKPGWIIVEIKTGLLKIKDIYQVKMYSEVFGSLNSFLISDTQPTVRMERFLKGRPQILTTHSGKGKVFIGAFRERKKTKSGATIRSMYWFPCSPFGDIVG